MASDLSPEEQLRLLFTGAHPKLEASRRLMRMLPSSPRCRVCYAPFGNLGGAVLRRRGFEPWDKNPNICQRCIVELDGVDARGCEVEISMLFADVRDSTGLAGRMEASAFTALMNRFFRVATSVLLDAEALVDKFVGDEVIGLFVPVIAGPNHPRRAVEAARALLRETGHGHQPWVPLGVGVHTGPAFLGLVGDGVMADFTAMGDSMNLAARLAGAAGAGEVLATGAAAEAAGIDDGQEHRTLRLKGFADPVDVTVLRASQAQPTL